MVKKLVVLAGPDEGRSFELGSEVMMLGRSRATETPLIDPHVSPIHCQIVKEGDVYAVIDYDTMGGTFVNGKEIRRQVLKAGDLIRIGSTHLQYVDAPAGEDGPAQAKPVQRPAFPKKSIEWANALVGQSLSHYEISAVLAAGRTGVVFHARDSRNDVPVALKVLPTEFNQDEKRVQHFVEAMKAVLPLNHPHLLKIYGAGRAGKHCWVAAEYLPSENLSAVIARIEKAGKIDWKLVLRVAAYLSQALEYAHQKNLVHQNVTPQNVLIGRKLPKTKLTDLMLATATEEDPTKPVSADGTPSESLSYMSPERTDGATAVIDVRTDVYSLAAVIYAMLAGRAPFVGATVPEVIEKIRLDEPPRLHAVNPHMPQTLEKVLRQAMAKRVQDRPATAADLRKEFEKIAHDHGVAL